MRRAMGLLFGVIGGVIIFAMMVSDTPRQQALVIAYVMAFGCFIAGIYINSLQKALDEAWEGSDVRDKRIQKLGKQMQDQLDESERLHRDLRIAREDIADGKSARIMLAQEVRDKALIIRRLNIILREHGIDTTAANILPSAAGGDALASARMSRGNPVPPPPMPAHLSAHRVNMSSPNQPSAPVHDNSGDLLTGVALGMLLADDPAPAPAPAYCAPEPTRSEPVCSPSRDADYGGNSDSGSSSDSGGSSGD
jgi:hypothetical protein